MASEAIGHRRPAAILAGIKERGYRNGATGVQCARLSDAAAEDVPLLLAAVEAVLKEADDFEVNRPERLVTRRYAAECFRAAITRGLTGKEARE
jgi:hypothetical protein